MRVFVICGVEISDMGLSDGVVAILDVAAMKGGHEVAKKTASVSQAKLGQSQSLTIIEESRK